MQCKYIVLPRVRTPSVNPGDNIDIELFLTGYGVPQRNKLYIAYSSQLIDASNPIRIQSSIAVASDGKGEKRALTGTEVLQVNDLDIAGCTMNLNKGYFMDRPQEKVPADGIPQLTSEVTWDGHPPLLLMLRASQRAPAGDYDIHFALSYSDDAGMEISMARAIVHVRDWWERHRGQATVTAIVIALLSLASSGLYSAVNLWRMFTGQ